MKTLRFETRLSLEDLTSIDAPVPEPGPGQVLVRVHAVSLNYRDVAVARGAYAGVSAPLIPGSDAAGEVVGVGPDVTRFTVGDRVCLAYVPRWLDGPARAGVTRDRLGGPSDGVLRELVVADEAAVVRAPRHLSDVEAATLPIAGVSVWQALMVDGHVGPGDTVCVAGTGGVALFVVQIARLAGASVIVLGRDPQKLERVKAMGVGTLDLRSEPDFGRSLRERTDGEGVDHFLDVLGGEHLGAAIAATRVGGTVSLFGFAASPLASLDLLATIRRAVTLRATSGGSRASFEALVRAMEAHEVRPVVDRVFPFGLEPVRQAYRHVAEGRPFGKVVVAMEGAR